MVRHPRSRLLLALAMTLALGWASCGSGPGGTDGGGGTDAMSGPDAGRDTTLRPCDPPATGTTYACGTWQLDEAPPHVLDSTLVTCTLQMVAGMRTVFFESGTIDQRVNVSQLTLDPGNSLGTDFAVGLLADAGEEVQGLFPGSDSGRCTLDPRESLWVEEGVGVAFRSVGTCSKGTGAGLVAGSFDLVVRGCL